MKEKKDLYFIAIIPPEPLYSEINNLKEYVKEEYASKASLKSPPHITLYMPFKMKSEKVEELTLSLSQITHKEFILDLKNFGAFPPRVIYVGLEENEHLYQLWKKLIKIMQLNGFNNPDYKNRGLTPHLTIAFRDLRKAEFNRAWKEFEEKPFSGSFSVKSFFLLKHDGTRWQVYREIGFAS